MTTLGIGTSTPKKIPCGWSDGSAKKVDISLEIDGSLTSALNDQEIQVFFGSGVDCDEHARPTPVDRNIVMTLQEGEHSVQELTSHDVMLKKKYIKC